MAKDELKMLNINVMQAVGEHAGSQFFSQFPQLFKHHLEIITLQNQDVIENDVFFYTVRVSNPVDSLLRKYCNDNGRKHFIDEIPLEVKKALVRGNAYLILDLSHEGTDTVPVFKELNHESQKTCKFSHDLLECSIASKSYD